jgi:hypothetical protein
MKELKERRNVFICPDVLNVVYQNITNGFDKGLRKPLVKVLDKSNHTPHPFIVECIVQGCSRNFKDVDVLKNHFEESH